jgi:hypothetical protein
MFQGEKHTHQENEEDGQKKILLPMGKMGKARSTCSEQLGWCLNHCCFCTMSIFCYCCKSRGRVENDAKTRELVFSTWAEFEQALTCMYEQNSHG